MTKTYSAYQVDYEVTVSGRTTVRTAHVVTDSVANAISYIGLKFAFSQVKVQAVSTVIDEVYVDNNLFVL